MTATLTSGPAPLTDDSIRPAAGKRDRAASGNQAQPPADRLPIQLPGRLAGAYVPERVLGDSAVGRVVLARGTMSDRRVAVKILAPHLAAVPAVRARFLRAADLAARLSHPNAVRLLAAGDGGEPFVVMEHIEGETLAQRVASRGRLSAAETLELATHLAAGLAHAHANGVVHDGLDARSILMGHDGVARLTDFGLARVLAEPGPRRGLAGDVRALALVLRQVAGEDLPPALDALIDAALSSDPSAWPCAVDVHHLVLTITGPTEVWLPPSEGSTWNAPLDTVSAPSPA